MFIKALILDEHGNQHIIKAENECDIIMPKGLKEQIQFAFETAKLLKKFYIKLKAYANPENCLVTIETDNPVIARELQQRDYNVIFTLLDGDQAEG